MSAIADKTCVVKLRAKPDPGTEREYAAAARELSLTGHYKVRRIIYDANTEWLYLDGGMTPYNAKLFEVGGI